MNYGVAHTTNISGRCFDFCAKEPIENGSLVIMGDLVDGHKNVYYAEKPTTANIAKGKVFLANNPAWSYDDSRAVNQNEDNYIIEAGTIFRVYELKDLDKFEVSENMFKPIAGTDLAAGQYVSVENDSFKLVVSAAEPADVNFVGKIISVEEKGFPYCIGSAGTPLTIGSEFMGNVLDMRNKFVTVQVIHN